MILLQSAKVLFYEDSWLTLNTLDAEANLSFRFIWHINQLCVDFLMPIILSIRLLYHISRNAEFDS